MPPRTHQENRTSSPSLSDLENAPALSIQMSPADLLKVARQYEVEKNMAQAEVTRLNRRLADVTNDGDNSTHMPKRRRTNRHPVNASSDEEDVTATVTRTHEHFVYQAGHKFFLLYGPWLHGGEDIFDVSIDKQYITAERFENDENKVQGQLQEILGLLRPKFEQQTLSQTWLRRQFMAGFHTQRYNTATRIQHNCASILGVSEADLLKSDIRRDKFRQEIGWVNEARMYSSVDVPILHKDWCGEYALSSIFLNPKLMGIYVALIRGPRAGKYFMNGEIFRPQTETMARIHGIYNITPGAIAACAILVRWALSADDTLHEVGSSTGIRYFNDFEEYLTILETGLRQKKKSILNIIKKWDEKIFPDSGSSLVGSGESSGSVGLKKMMDLLAADSEEDS